MWDDFNTSHYNSIPILIILNKILFWNISRPIYTIQTYVCLPCEITMLKIYYFKKYFLIWNRCIMWFWLYLLSLQCLHVFEPKGVDIYYNLLAYTLIYLLVPYLLLDDNTWAKHNRDIIIQEQKRSFALFCSRKLKKTLSCYVLAWLLLWKVLGRLALLHWMLWKTLFNQKYELYLHELWTRMSLLDQPMTDQYGLYVCSSTKT